MRAGRARSLATILRPTETRNARGATTVSYVASGTPWVRIDNVSRLLRNFGAGEMPEGTMGMEAHLQSGIQARDVLRIDAGPEAGSAWRVEGVTSPDGYSLFGALTVFNEPLP